ncbi:oxidoreductase domain protein [Basidiobolus meristosporus CBS 931.73]|uniref:Oxidoreductase domain protein n=1 Tax=Basidiobolus meristosporus CBS 931.73 TaxID=1314790 RepID=A0A1Y1Z1G3_9FUNG|nr:oxidoreductase domain protein [Basidiobolus meristosporus CBS 931.73]|eukprot:ORY03777.1 oxidoreductase domain protein [Basidiobolus meristosporus CBS 931.73]
MCESLPQFPITVSIVGAGSRGSSYASFALKNPDLLKVVAVAEPKDIRRNFMATKYNISPENVFSDWKELAERPRLSNAVVIATFDHLHVEPTIELSRLGYHIMLEKPMAVSIKDCQRIVEAVNRSKVIFAVCHVLRYTPYNRMLKKLIQSDAVGNIINIQHLEPVGHSQFAHSFVRGNYQRENRSSNVLMNKCIHDLDLLAHLVGRRCVKISSFGNISHFKPDRKPKQAGEAKLCVDCPYESKCAYSAVKIYLDPVKEGQTGWPISTITDIVDIENVTRALEDGPYGRCVHECDNDVCDNQVVNMIFENGSTCTLTVVAGTQAICQGKTRVFGTKGELDGDGKVIKFTDFRTGKRVEIDPVGQQETDEPDYDLMRAFVNAIAQGSAEGYIFTGPEEAFNCHVYGFAAEHARTHNTVVTLDEFRQLHSC